MFLVGLALNFDATHHELEENINAVDNWAELYMLV